MLALRFAALLALAVWVGGAALLGVVVAPATFDILGAEGPEGRLRAAALFGEELRRFQAVTYGCAALILTSLAVRAVLGPRPRRFAVRAIIAAGMLAATLWSGLVLAPQIAGVQREIGGLPSALSADDPRRTAFTRLHRLSTAAQMLPLLAGLALMFWELED